jgi:hypothetical protein
MSPGFALAAQSKPNILLIVSDDTGATATSSVAST